MKLLSLLETLPQNESDQLDEVTAHFRVTPAMLSNARGNSSQVIVEMPPEDFLKLTTHTEEDWVHFLRAAKPLVQYNRYSKMGNDDKYLDWVNRGKDRKDDDYELGSRQHPFLMIQIDETNPTRGKVMKHEGRHRAAAYMKRGGKSYPVALMLRGDVEIPGKPNYDDSKWWLSAVNLPKTIQGQYTSVNVDTSRWKVTSDQPLRRKD